MKKPSARFHGLLHARPRPGFTTPSLLLLLAASWSICSGITTNIVSDGPLRPDEAALIGIFKGTVDVTASDAKIDRARLLDRVLASGSVDDVQYADDDRCSE